MFFTKEVRSHGERPYGRKEYLAPTDDENTDLGVLDTKNRTGRFMALALQESLLPEILVLKCKIQGVPLHCTSTMISLRIDDQMLPMIPFYGTQILERNQRGHSQHSVHEAVNLVFTGNGYCYFDGKERPLEQGDFKLNVAAQDPLLTKPFKVQTAGHLIQRQTRLPSGEWSVTPPRGGQSLIKTLPLMAYGGYVKPGLSLDQVTQIFGSLEKSDMGKGYKLRLRSQKELEVLRVSIPHGGVIQETAYAFNESFLADEKLSLVGLIDAGKACVEIIIDGGKPSVERFTYQSFKYVQEDPSTDTLDLYFKSQKIHEHDGR